MSLYHCPTCKQFIQKSRLCDPHFVCWDEGSTEDNGRIMFAIDARAAAEKYAKAADLRSWGYLEHLYVLVKQDGDSKAIKFIVFLEREPVYTARRCGSESTTSTHDQNEDCEDYLS